MNVCRAEAAHPQRCLWELRAGKGQCEKVPCVFRVFFILPEPLSLLESAWAEGDMGLGALPALVLGGMCWCCPWVSAKPLRPVEVRRGNEEEEERQCFWCWGGQEVEWEVKVVGRPGRSGRPSPSGGHDAVEGAEH